MNIFDRIEQDHDVARDMIAKLKDTSDRAKKTRRELFDAFKIEMWVHHKVEEAVLYHSLRQDKDMRSEALEAFNEHHVANGLIEELDTFPVDSEDWAVKFGSLAELIEHHMEEEEDDIFPEARKHLSKEVQELMGKRFDQRKKVVTAALEPMELEVESA